MNRFLPLGVVLALLLPAPFAAAEADLRASSPLCDVVTVCVDILCPVPGLDVLPHWSDWLLGCVESIHVHGILSV